MEEDMGTALENKLLTIHSKVFSDVVPPKTSFPYLTFRLGTIVKKEGTKATTVLEVDVWDNKGKDIKQLLAIAKQVEKLHKCRIWNDELDMTLNLETSFSLPDPEPAIRRKHATFSINYYNKEE